MNKKDLRDIGVALALAVILCLGVTVCGCSNLESVNIGGNSQVVKNYVYSPGIGQEPTTRPATATTTNSAPVTITVTAHQTDGGTALLGTNPPTATPAPAPQPTTQPTTQPAN